MVPRRNGFELEHDFAASFTFTQGGAVTPSSLPLRCGDHSLKLAVGGGD
jgi:hypothetical protein